MEVLDALSSGSIDRVAAGARGLSDQKLLGCRLLLGDRHLVRGGLEPFEEFGG
jgi:hypothetical protein